MSKWLGVLQGRGQASTYRNLVFDPGQLLLCFCQLGIGLLQGLPLGGHIAVDFVEADDVDAPGAQTCGSRGLGADELRVKRGVALVGPGEETGAEWALPGRRPWFQPPTAGWASQATLAAAGQGRY